MPFTSEEEDRIREIFDEQLERFLKYQLRAFEPPEAVKTPENPLAKLPKEIAEKLEATQEQGNWIIHTKAHLPTEDFKRVCDTFKALGGDYIRATNDTPAYWAVPK